MKSVIGKWSFVAVALASLSASAISIPGWERPVQRANLVHVESTGGAIAYPRATSLAMNKRDGAEFATSFTLVEDTGIRCIMAPCPSFKRTQFVVTDVQEFRNGMVEFQAVEKITVTDPRVRIAPRRLEVRDNSEVVFGNPEWVWEVKVVSFPRRVSKFGGNPEGVITIQ